MSQPEARPKTYIQMQGSVAHLLLDDPAQKVNTLGLAMLNEIRVQFEVLRSDSNVEAVVLRSGKASGFVAGADIGELQAMSRASDAREQGYGAARLGQQLMDLIEDFPKPVVVGIHGAALGGGLELALAAHARVATDHESTKLGLPELKLGIVPGFGGTLRLPRLMGLARALPAILASSNIESKKALKQGLIDDVCAPEQLAASAQALAQRLLKPGQKMALQAKRRATLPLMMKVMEWPGLRGIVFSKAKTEVLAKTQGQYPAPLIMLDHLKRQFGAGRPEFLDSEAQALAQSLATEVSRNLLNIFFLNQDAKKQAGVAKPVKVNRVAVIGSGFMGSGIAIPLVTRAKLPTYLKDSSLEILGRAQKKVWDGIEKRLKKRQITLVEARDQMDRLTPITALPALRHAQVVIEAVPEILDLKKKIFAELEANIDSSAIIASNTSTLPIKDLCAGAKRPERFIGMHFFSPAEVMPLVEIIPGPQTSAEVIATVVELSLKMGKTPVVVADSPGFLVNRILMPYILEAAQMIQEGVAVAEVDRVAVKFGMPVGPIKLMGEVGAEVIVKVYHILRGYFGDHLPKPAWVDLADMPKAFVKENGKLRVDEAMIQAWAAASTVISEQDIEDRLLHAMFNEAARCLQESVVKDAAMLDLAMIFGTGFPAFRGGLLREAESRNLKSVVQRGLVLAERYGAWLTPPQALKDAAERDAFYPPAA